MARPLSCRRIHADPGVLYYKPRGVPSSALEEEVLTLDEFEAAEGSFHLLAEQTLRPREPFFVLENYRVLDGRQCCR